MPNSPSTSDSPSRPRSYQHTSTHPPATQQPPEPTSISANSPMSAPPGSNPTAPPFFPDALSSEIASGVIDSARESSSQDSNRGQVQTRVRAHNSARVTDFINPQTKVVSTVVTGPKDHITDPTLFQQGGAAQAMYPETPEDEEKLFSSTIKLLVRYMVRELTSHSFQTKESVEGVLRLRQGTTHCLFLYRST